MFVEKKSSSCIPPKFDEEVTITLTGKELKYIRNSLVVLLKKYISKLYSCTSLEGFDIHYDDSDELIVCIHEIYNLSSDFDVIFRLPF